MNNENSRSNNKFNYLDELLRKIKKPINYDETETEFIEKERGVLKKLIKKLSKKLD
jgi:hypothetical protein